MKFFCKIYNFFFLLVFGWIVFALVTTFSSIKEKEREQSRLGVSVLSIEKGKVLLCGVQAKVIALYNDSLYISYAFYDEGKECEIEIIDESEEVIGKWLLAEKTGIISIPNPNRENLDFIFRARLLGSKSTFSGPVTMK